MRQRGHSPVIRRWTLGVGVSLCLLAVGASSAFAQTSSVCAQVKIEILQELTFERVAFDARLAITNNLTDEPLTNFGVDLNITRIDGSPADELFFINVEELQNLGAVDGTGQIPSSAQGVARWLIIPTAGAGGTEPLGQTYLVGGTVNFQTSTGAQSLDLFPAPIRVRPQPLLQVDYFLPFTVRADDPFTPPVEPPVPFTLGALVSNVGFGDARNLEIISGQPTIVENEQGLLIGFQLLGTSVNGSPVEPTLNATFGTIEPGDCGVAAWEMITTLSGEFVEFEASYTHAPELGGELTSLIEGTSANRLVHEMLVDLPGRDEIKDFLADVDRDEEFLPDTIFESECNQLPVNPIDGMTTGNPTFNDPFIPLTTDVLAGWTFTRVDDPSEGLIPLVAVTRSDGKQLRPENFWISRVQDEDIKDLFYFFVNIVDFATTGSYTLKYQDLGPDGVPPVSEVVFQAPAFGSDPVFVTPTTQILFTATDDISGVEAIERSLDGAPFEPAFPFAILDPGPHTLQFRARDRAGNEETPNLVNVFVDPDAPAIDPVLPQPSTITPAAPEGVDADRVTTLTVLATDAIDDLTGVLDIASGTDPDFSTLPIVRSLPFTLRSGVPNALIWDGTDGAGIPVPEGVYTLRVTVDDPLGSSANQLAIVAVDEYLQQDEAASAAGADQQYPDLTGTQLVWQDNRNGDWDVFLLDTSGGAPVNLTAGQPADQQRPATDGTWVVWQDRRNGNWDVFLYEIATQTTTPFATEIENQENPVVAAPWVVWQERRGAVYDVVAKHIVTGEVVELSAGDPGIHDQIRPAISGVRVVFEDYRFGLADIFLYDLDARTEQQLSTNTDNQTRPSIDGDTVVWVDQRHANRDLYLYDLSQGVERRLTYTSTDESQPFVRGDRLVYTDFAAGLTDPAIATLQLATRRGLRVTSDPARQEEPTAAGDVIAWQDDRTGRWQIRTTDLAPGGVGLSRELAPGLNLIGVSDQEAAANPTAFGLLAAWNLSTGAVEIQKFDPPTGRLLSARIPGGVLEGDDFPVAEGDALIVLSPAASTLGLVAPSSCADSSVAAGANYVALPCVPPGFTARDWIEALGVGKITSIARYDTRTGRWKTLAVDGTAFAGENFPIVPGEGYLVYASEAAGPFLP